MQAIRVYPKIVHWLMGRGLSWSSTVIDQTGKEWLHPFASKIYIFNSWWNRTESVQKEEELTSFNGFVKWLDSDLSTSILANFFLGAFSNTIDNWLPLFEWIPNVFVEVDVNANALVANKAVDAITNFILHYGTINKNFFFLKLKIIRTIKDQTVTHSERERDSKKIVTQTYFY